MAYITHSNSIIHKEFFKPLFDLLEGAKQHRECCVLDDSLWLEVGVRRCLNIFQSGRDLIQYLAEQHNTEILVSTFFESLKSKRRLGLLDELLGLMQPYMRRNLPDAFEHHACLEDFELYVWDRAGIDFRQWHEWKRMSGIYFLSRQKDNMKLEVIGANPWDAECAQNHGVISDEIVATSQGVSVRRVTYRDADTGIIYHYLTNLAVGVHPGVVALLYKSRWDIEKVFDEFKNKLVEKKAWASSATAKTQQARLLCLTHNLLTLMEHKIKDQDGVYNRAEFERRAKRELVLIEARPARPTVSNMQQSAATASTHQACQRLTQRTVRFIRWLKNHLDLQRDWGEAIAKLDHAYSR